ncbi:hypothetical protein HDA40_007373 [Hamadaea flava]|uniref:Scramblase n=1 Tax=Hamadaea flava TaxID=1742688 RepID=A0ABV8LY00_9ACTN|nr:phospholipid scramblase family protein [Hamadaea flava]MCP2328866.1 hypothetical protein [Hamadaea flava]
MTLFAPFSGTLYLPDKEFLNTSTPVLLPDGRPIAGIVWHTWTQRFEITDPAGSVVAECRPEGVFRRRFPVRTLDGRRVVQLIPGAWRPFNGAELILAAGGQLTVRQVSVWSDRKFEFYGQHGLVGRIMPTTGTFSFRPDSYAFEVLAPVMSALEAIAIAQALRLVARGNRSSAAAASSV